MKAYKVELLVIDNECVGEKGIIYYLENVKYLYPKVMAIQSKEIGEWHDLHPFNCEDKVYKECYETFFSDT